MTIPEQVILWVTSGFLGYQIGDLVSSFVRELFPEEAGKPIVGWTYVRLDSNPFDRIQVSVDEIREDHVHFFFQAPDGTFITSGSGHSMPIKHFNKLYRASHHLTDPRKS